MLVNSLSRLSLLVKLKIKNGAYRDIGMCEYTEHVLGRKPLCQSSSSDLVHPFSLLHHSPVIMSRSAQFARTGTAVPPPTVVPGASCQSNTLSAVRVTNLRMKLDVGSLRYLTKEDFRVLTAIGMGSENHEIVPVELVSRNSESKTFCPAFPPSRVLSSTQTAPTPKGK